MPAIPAEYLDLLQKKAAFAHLATIMPDGTPQVTPVWFDYKDGKIRINSAKGRVKARNMREGAPVALSILDPDHPYRYIQIRGRVEPRGRGGRIGAHRFAREEVPRERQISLGPTWPGQDHV